MSLVSTRSGFDGRAARKMPSMVTENCGVSDMGFGLRSQSKIGLKLAIYACLFMLFSGVMLGRLAHKYGLFEQLQLLAPHPVPLKKLPISADPGLDKYLPKRFPSTIPDIEIIGVNEWRLGVRTMLIDSLGMREVFGERNTITIEILERVDIDEQLERVLLAFRSFDGTSIPAYLHQQKYRPQESKYPGIIVIPGHVREGESGIEQTAVDSNSYQHAAAMELAKVGYITLTFELRGFGYLGSPYDLEHRVVAWNALLKGESYKQVMLKDIAYAKKLLLDWDGVDSNRIGMTGVSYGGELTLQYAGLDEDIKVIVFQGFGGKTGVKESILGGRDDQPHYCHILPYFDSIIGQQEYIWLLSPRPTLGLRGTQEGKIDLYAVNEYRKGWQHSGDQNNFEFRQFNGGHQYSLVDAIDFFGTHLE